MSESRLYRVTIAFERKPRSADDLADAVQRLVCPHADTSDHACPHRWMIMSGDLEDDDEAAVKKLWTL